MDGKPEVPNEEVQNGNKPQVNVDDLVSRMEALEQTNKRLLEESKHNKEKYVNLRSEVEQKEKVKLEESENWKELLEIEKNEKFELASKLKQYKKDSIQKDLQFKVASLAKDAHDVSDVIRSLPKEMLSIDQETGSISGVEEAYNTVRQQKPYLFDTQRKSGMTADRPQMPKDKTLDEQIEEDPNAIWKSALEDLLSK